jgi:hypothetical protein
MSNYASLQRASVFAVKKETTSGELIYPTAGTDFIPLRTGFAMNEALEEITNEELKNDIGATKSYTGKENPTGSHAAYLKGKGVVGLPNYGVFFESALGAESLRTSTDVIVAGTTATVIKVADTSGYAVGQTIMVAGVIRNIKSIDSATDMTVNFAFPSVPATGATIEKNYGYKPAATDHPSFSSWMYTSSGTATQAVAGCRTTSSSISLTSGQQAEVNFDYAGVKYFLNPIKIEATNKYLDIEDNNTDVVAVAVTEKVYRTPQELADEITSLVAAATGESFTCTFSSVDGKFTIANGDGNFELLFATGANVANSIATTLGYTAADKTGADTYEAENALTYAVPYTASYDSADSIIVKSAELMIGDSSDSFCRKASTLSITIDTPVTDVDSICSESGVLEKLILSRGVTLNATILLEKHEIALFDKMIQNKTTQAMVNLGPLTGTQFTTGKSVNIYLGNASITNHGIGGDDVVTVDLTMKGFVDTDLKDIYVNFV